LDTAPLTALIGGNNVGKSTFLKAIEIFFEAQPKITHEDFCQGHEGEPIEITVRFAKLTPSERAEFGTAVIDGSMTVSRRLSLTEKDSGQYSVQALVFPEFAAVRAEENGTKRRTMYNALLKQIPELGSIESHTEIEAAFSKWEQANLDKLQPEKIRAFFGATNIASGKLRKKTGLHLVPAVRDASVEGSDPRRSPIISLLADIAKQTFENRKETAEFLEKAKQEFEALSDPARIPELAEINDLLSSSIQRFYADSRLAAKWEKSDGITLSFPVPRLEIEHNGIPTELARVGHGLQRAALFAIVQFLAERRAEDGSDVDNVFNEAASDIIILIEEPEIYQHPAKQLVIFEAFKKIAASFNQQTGIRIQLIYTTHSEKFVRMSDFDIARILRRGDQEAEVSTKVSNLTIEECRRGMAMLHQPPRNPMPLEAFVAKLHIFTREVCEAFFADRIILVEGRTDQAVLEACYASKGRNIHAESIAIVSVDGKTKMDKPAFIFRKLGIPTHIVFDNDAGKPAGERKPNQLLQRICGVENPIEFPVGANSDYTAVQGDLESYLQARLGAKYNELFEQVVFEFGLNYAEIKKTPAALATLFRKAQEAGISFPLFDEILANTDNL